MDASFTTPAMRQCALAGDGRTLAHLERNR